MEFEDFLQGLSSTNSVLRHQWWVRFQDAETCAKSCVEDKWEFVDITSVILTHNNLWHSDGTVEIDPGSLESGSLYHEIFHSALHKAPFKIKAEENKPNYELYVECLCNAFQYFMETSLGPSGGWVARLEDWRLKTWGELIYGSGDLPWDMTYGLPALEFIKACSRFEEFKRMFQAMNAKSSS